MVSAVNFSGYLLVNLPVFLIYLDERNNQYILEKKGLVGCNRGEEEDCIKK